jgi:murein peptide amidase A
MIIVHRPGLARLLVFLAALMVAVAAACLIGLPIGLAGSGNRAAIRIGGRPLALVAGDGSVWALTCDRGCTGEARHSIGRVVRVDPASGRIVASVTVTRPQDLAVSADGVYGLDFWRGDVYRLDPLSLQLTARTHLVLPFQVAPGDRAFLPETVSVGAGSVWVTTNRGAIARLDPRTLRLRSIVPLDRLPLDSATAGAGAVWAAGELAGVSRIDLAANRVAARILIERSGRRLSVGRILLAGGRVLAVGVWADGGVATNANGVARINPVSGRVEGVSSLPDGNVAVTSGGGSLWAAQVGGSAVEQIDPQTGRMTARFPAAVGQLLAFADARLWTATKSGIIRRFAAPRRVQAAGRASASNRLFPIGRSGQGRPIVAVRVGDPHGRQLLVVGCIHGTECAGIAITRALEQTHTTADLWIVPDLNPDGYAHGTRQNAYGVDLNANWSSGWQAGGRPWDFSYPGPRPFSETETRIARNLILRIHPEATVWYHQHMNLVWARGPSTSAGRAYARTAGMRFYHHPWLHGTATNWQNHHLLGTTSFTVELPAGQLTPQQVRRQVRAVLALAARG